MLLAKKDKAGVILSNVQNDFLLADAAQMEEIEDLSTNICMIARIQQATTDYDEGPSYDSAFISKQPEIVNSTNDDQINSDIIFDDTNIEINDGNIEHDKNDHDQHDNELKLLAIIAYKEAEKKLILAKKQAISENPKLYDASYLHSSKVRAKVRDTKEILEDATKSQIKMENKLKDPIAIEKKQNFCPINYGKLNDLYETFVPQVELSLKQKYFSETSTSSGTPTSAIKSTPKSIFYTNREDTILSQFCYDEVKLILDCLHTVFKAIQTKFPEEVKVMMDVFDKIKSEHDATLRQNEILTKRLLEATLIHDIEKCVSMCFDSMNDKLRVEIEKVKRDSVDVQENLLKQIKILENDFQRCQK
ncbi:hypothetical protein Tco_1045281 [Tanacetum coccineum]|uniref:Uncharacterized protein n=1 Tax=Tanacetum coccineum TaxID=301880 RepID=A0ABQ5GSB0_9ASTR